MFVKYEGWTCPSMSLDAKHDMWTYLVWNSVKWKYWNDPCRENEMLAYVVRSLINSELVPRCPLMRNMICEPIWFYIRKNESIGMTLSRKWDFSLYDKGWTCPSISLDTKHDMWTYLVLYSAKWNYLNDHCPKNEIFAYMVKSLININVEIVPWCPLLRNIIFEPISF
jgi:hypothetical protein